MVANVQWANKLCCRKVSLESPGEFAKMGTLSVSTDTQHSIPKLNVVKQKKPLCFHDFVSRTGSSASSRVDREAGV